MAGEVPDGPNRCLHAPASGYTNNKLLPAQGFKIRQNTWLIRHSGRTDRHGPEARYANQARHRLLQGSVTPGRVVPRTVEHNGSVATLEDWFDERRLRDDYVPTGFKGYNVSTRAVKGHEFGLKLSADEKKALFAFLKTL
jgi:hypothetical protein